MKHKELTMEFLNLKAYPNDILPPTRPHQLILPPEVPQIEDQALKYMNIWTPFLSKLPQGILLT